MRHQTKVFGTLPDVLWIFKSNCFHIITILKSVTSFSPHRDWTEPLLNANDSTQRWIRWSLYLKGPYILAKNISHGLTQKEVVGSTYSVRNDFITWCWYMDCYFLERQHQGQEGMPGKGKSLSKLLKMGRAGHSQGTRKSSEGLQIKYERAEWEKSDSSAAHNANVHGSCLKYLLRWGM